MPAKSKIKPNTTSLITSREDYSRPSDQFMFDAIVHMSAANVITNDEALQLIDKVETWRILNQQPPAKKVMTAYLASSKEYAQ